MSNTLIVVDMQNDFITGPLGTPEAREIVPKVAEKISNFEGQIFYTADTHFSAVYLHTQEGINLPVPHCIFGTFGWEIVPAVQSALECALGEEYVKKYMIVKKTFGSFELKHCVGVLDEDDCVELVGVCTDICVISNALLIKAFYPEIRISVDASCCAGTSPEMHRKALDVMRSCQIKVINDG